MAKHDIVVIGASAGGVYALRELVASFPPDCQASVFIVQHVAPFTRSYLPSILNSAGPLEAIHPQDGERIKPGMIYVAPPDHHLLIEEGHVLVKKGPKENRFRPSIDALFRSAAYTYGPRTIGVVLTGLLNDGTSGMWSVKRLGGVGIVQAPEEALYPSMPESVLEYVEVDHVLPISEIAPLVCRLLEEPAEEVEQEPLPGPANQRMNLEIHMAAEENVGLDILNMGELTSLTCPECHGTLVSIKEGKLIRYRCHTGHAFTASSLLAEVTKVTEEKLWQGVRSLDETMILLEQAGKQLSEGGNKEAAKQFLEKARQAAERRNRLRELIFQQQQQSEDELPN